LSRAAGDSAVDLTQRAAARGGTRFRGVSSLSPAWSRGFAAAPYQGAFHHVGIEALAALLKWRACGTVAAGL